MDNKFYITFDKSQEDIPTLVVFAESYFLTGPSMKVINVITGDRAVAMWDELKGKEKKNMSTVTKCDRCGTIFNSMNIEELDQNYDPDASWRLNMAKELWPHAGESKIDLCPDCKKRLHDWAVYGR